MKDEKMMVLQMVQDGKISADDAVKLLQALAVAQENTNTNESTSADMDEKLNNFYQSVECFAKDCNEKFSAVAKDVEPKIKEATKIVVEKTTKLLDSISNSLKESTKADEKETVEPCQEKEDCCEDCQEDNEPKQN